MKFGIIGFGRFGQLWANSLLPFGDVFVYDKSMVQQSATSRIKKSTLQDLAQVDVIFILVPISSFENSCVEIKNILKPTTLVVDCCSVKIYPVDVMRRVFSSTQPLLATHPLFGPDSIKKSGGLVGHKIAICPIVPSEKKQNELQIIFNKMRLKTLITTPEEHDSQMANSQGLIHFIGRGLLGLDLGQQELATPDFQALLNINSMVTNDTWQLFLDMQQYNPYVKEIRQKLINQLISLDKKIEEEPLLTIELLRKKIEQTDANIIEKLAEREELSKQIGQSKLKKGTNIIDPSREKELFEFYGSLCEKYKLPQTFVKRLFKIIITRSRKVQKL